MMGTELIRHHVKDESMDMPSIPPGFESLAAFSLKRVEESKVESSCSVSTSPSASQSAKKESGTEQSDSENIKRSNRRKLNYGRIDTSSGDESGSENQTSSAPISKGVIRGCQECGNCQKVIARWRPEESRKPDLLDAPVFYPTEEV
nr:putative lysine-specific demethylase JMJ16 isoform X1 [Tanacetum cinerariifolium]